MAANVRGFAQAGYLYSVSPAVKPFGLMMFEDILKFDALLSARNWSWVAISSWSSFCQPRLLQNRCCRQGENRDFAVIDYSSSWIINNFFIVVTVTRCSGVNPNLSSHTPLNLMTGTIVLLHRFNFISGWIFKLLTSGRLLVFFFSGVRICLKGFKWPGSAAYTQEDLRWTGLTPALCQADRWIVVSRKLLLECTQFKASVDVRKSNEVFPIFRCVFSGLSPRKL